MQPVSPPPLKPPTVGKTVAWHKAFITGLLVLAPLGVSMWVLNFLISNVGKPASRIFFGWVIGEDTSSLSIYLYDGLAMLVVFALITALGYASHYFFGRWLLHRAESLFSRIPLIGQVYRTTKQVVDTFHTQKKAAFEKIVLVQFPRTGLYSVGFLTNRVQGEVRVRTGEDFVNVFIPTTPNPTSGFLVMCRASELIELDMSVGDGMKLIISGGSIAPPVPAGATTPPVAQNPVAAGS